MKRFYISDDGIISQHKLRQKIIAAMGILYPDQKLIVYTSKRQMTFKYTDIKVYGHLKRQLFFRDDNEVVTKVDIVSNPKPIFKSAAEYLASDMAKETEE